MADRAEGSWGSQLRSLLLAPRLTLNDRILTGLAALDIVLLAIRSDIDLPGTEFEPQIVRAIHLFDFFVVAVFAVEFLATLAFTRHRVRFLKANWYDLVGLIPIHSAILRAFRLGRIVRIYVWGSRFPSEVEERFGGEPYAVRVLRAYEPVLVEELTDPLLLRLLKVLRRVLGEARYATAVGESLEARREEIHRVVVDAIRASPVARAAYAVGPVRAGIDEAERQAVDVAVTALKDPRLDEVIRRAIDDALEGLERRVEDKAWRREGLPSVVP